MKKGTVTATSDIGLPHDIEGLVDYGRSPFLWPALIAGGVLFCATLIWAIWVWRRRGGTPAVPVVDPWAVLLDEVKNLPLSTPFVGRTAETFFFELSLRLRTAFEWAFGFAATDRTTSEVRQSDFSALPSGVVDLEACLAFLERADAVKFAAAPASEAEGLAYREQVMAWIRDLGNGLKAAHEPARAQTQSPPASAPPQTATPAYPSALAEARYRENKGLARLKGGAS